MLFLGQPAACSALHPTANAVHLLGSKTRWPASLLQFLSAFERLMQAPCER